MKITVWNAYASNNSGSYTIVGALPSDEVAAEVAATLTTVIAAHTAWRDAWSGEGSTDASPLGVFCRENGLAWKDGEGGWDEWPQYDEDNRPRVVALGRQVIVHHGYTVTLPRAFGELFYKRGGRVQHEEDHAHHPLVVIGSFYWGWTPEARARQAEERSRLLAALLAPEGALSRVSRASFSPAWRAADEFLEAPLTVGAIFADLIDGVAAMQAAAERHHATLVVRVHESPSDRADPLAHLRPSTPPVDRFDVVVRDPGRDPDGLAKVLHSAVSLYEGDAKRRLASLPAVVGRSLMPAPAEDAARLLREAGATVDVVRNDG
jgi:hypothetical protein